MSSLGLQERQSFELVTHPSGSFRHRGNSTDVSQPIENGTASQQVPDSHVISIGASEESRVELLEAVPASRQIVLEYPSINASVPAAAPVGSSIIPGLPKLSLASLPFMNKKEDHQGVTPPPQSRQVTSVRLVWQAGVRDLALHYLPAIHAPACVLSNRTVPAYTASQGPPA